MKHLNFGKDSNQEYNQNLFGHEAHKTTGGWPGRNINRRLSIKEGFHEGTAKNSETVERQTLDFQ